MLLTRQVTAYRVIFSICVVLAACISFPSCLSVKDYPKQPFVYKTTINVHTELKSSEKQDLQDRLQKQLDDSLKSRVVTRLIFTKRLIKPPVFDTAYATRSVKFMKALLNAQGFFSSDIQWDTTLKTVLDEQRVNIRFNVNTGKQTKIDSVGFALYDSNLQRLATRREERIMLKKGDPFTKEVVANELDRLTNVFRNNGYFRMVRDDLYAEADSVIAGLINPNLDPFEQLRLLEELKNRRENPTVNVTIKQRGKESAGHLKKYKIRNVSIYPDLILLEDTVLTGYDSIRSGNIVVYSNKNDFKTNFLVRNTYVLPDSLYRQRNYFKTVNNFNQLGAWQQATIDVYPDDSLGVLDMVIKLYPAKKYNIVVDLEASRNASDVLTSNLFGLGLNFGLRNRNMGRESIQTTTNLRFGVELGKQLVQTFQTSFSHTIYIPRFILPFKVKTDNLTSNRTIFNFNASNTIRRDFFSLQNINASWGYEWSKRYHSWYYSPLNLEYQRVGQTDSLRNIIKEIPNLANSFKNGFIISQNFVYRFARTRGRHNNTFKIGVEESGGLFGLIKDLDRKANLFRFVKLDLDFRHYINYKKSSWAFRLYGGMGLPYGKDENGIVESSLPVTRAFFAGGPTSMRAWQVRQLGVGSSLYYDTVSGGGIDRLGDIQLEGNAEYRFNVGTIAGIKVKSALFADVGNIWLRNDQGIPALKDGVFKLSRLYKDLAVGAGTSLRFDFEYFLIRFDWAYKIKNPIYSNINSGWFQNLQFATGQFQLGINYPF